MYKQKKLSLTFYLMVALLFTSCFNEKKITYFQKNLGERDTITVQENYIPKIQSGDILSIYVNSLSTEASTFFNPYATTPLVGGDNAGGLSQSAAPGFLVNEKGYIDLPLIGSISVSGLTTLQARDTIRNRLKFWLKEPTVIVRFLNYKISVIGEVVRPGVYVIPNEKISIPEAITIAGDLTVYAKRSDVMIIRDVDNKKEFVSVDLTSREVFSSPYYYLRSNDIVYVKPTKAKTAQSDLILRVLPITISVISLLIVILTKI